MTIKTKNLSYEDVAHNYAHHINNKDLPRASYSVGERLYYIGETAFSYGSHFIIAQFLPKLTKNNQTHLLFTKDTHSNTTAKHKRYISDALPDYYNKIYVSKIKINYINAASLITQLKYEFETIESEFCYKFKELSLKKSGSMIKDDIKNQISDNIANIDNLRHYIVDFLKEKIVTEKLAIKNRNSDAKKLPEYAKNYITDIEFHKKEILNYKQHLKFCEKEAVKKLHKIRELLQTAYTSKEYGLKIEKLRQDKIKLEKKKAARLEREKIKRFFNENYFFGRTSQGETLIKLDKDKIISSQKSEMEISDFRKFYALLRNGSLYGKTYKDIKFSTVNENIVTIGCHNIPRKNIEQVAKQLLTQ